MPDAAEPVGVGRREQAGGDDREHVVPVSYTHLTLPTSDLV